MTLGDFIEVEAVVVPLRAASREEAVAELVGSLALPGAPGDRSELVAAVLAREQAGSTGLGNGVAIPHARTRRLTLPRVAAGRAAKPIDFKAADGQPVSLIFLLAVPESDPRAHLQLLAALSRLASDKKRLKVLARAASPQDLFEQLSSWPV